VYRHIDAKTFFYVFLIFGHVYTLLTFFLFFRRLFLFFKNVGKVQSGKQINKKQFQKTPTK